MANGSPVLRPIPRRPVVSVAALLGQSSRQRPAPDDADQPLGDVLARAMPSTLAEALQASLPKSLQEALAEGLGIEARAVPDLDEFGVGETADLEDRSRCP